MKNIQSKDIISPVVESYSIEALVEYQRNHADYTGIEITAERLENSGALLFTYTKKEAEKDGYQRPTVITLPGIRNPRLGEYHGQMQTFFDAGAAKVACVHFPYDRVLDSSLLAHDLSEVMSREESTALIGVSIGCDMWLEYIRTGKLPQNIKSLLCISPILKRGGRVDELAGILTNVRLGKRATRLFNALGDQVSFEVPPLSTENVMQWVAGKLIPAAKEIVFDEPKLPHVMVAWVKKGEYIPLRAQQEILALLHTASETVIEAPNLDGPHGAVGDARWSSSYSNLISNWYQTIL